MSTYVLMRILESAPRRYDRGMRILTFGRVERAYDWLAQRIDAGEHVLDIGCGTAALSLRAARRGSTVCGIDRDPEMLALARRRIEEEHLEDRVELVEKGVADLDTETAESYDVVTSGLCFSELSPDEIAYTIRQVQRMLKPGGLLLVADEMVPERLLTRLAYLVLRVPLVIVAYLLTQQTTHPVRGLAEQLSGAGMTVLERRRTALGSFGCIVARKDNPASRVEAAQGDSA